MSVTEAVEAQVAELDAEDSPLASVALAMAEAIDAGGSRTSLAICAKELRDCMREWTCGGITKQKSEDRRQKTEARIGIQK